MVLRPPDNGPHVREMLTHFSRASRQFPLRNCALMGDARPKATWFLVEVQNYGSLQKTRQIAAALMVHLNLPCQCTALSQINLMAASTFLHEFLLPSKTVIDSMNVIEQQLKEAKEAETKAAVDYKSDIGELNKSKFISTVNKQVTVAHLKRLLAPALSSLSFYEAALTANETDYGLVKKIITGSFVLSNLNALYQIFTFYDLPNYAFRAATLACKVAQMFFGPTCDQQLSQVSLTSPEEVQVTFCNMVYFLMFTGCLASAISFYERHFVEQPIDIARIETFGQALMLLLKVEISLRTQEETSIWANQLRLFLDSPYFKSNTIKRYAIKIMTYALASKFSSTEYRFSNEFTEFAEPAQMAATVCKRWKMLSSFFKHNPNQPEDQPDPLWYRFLILNVASKSGDDFFQFSANVGMVPDSAFYFKLLLNLNTVTLNVSGIARILLMGAKLEVENDFLDDAQNKLNLIDSLFTVSSPHNESLFTAQLTDVVEGDGLFAFDDTQDLTTSVLMFYHEAVDDARLHILQQAACIIESEGDDISKLFMDQFEAMKKNGSPFGSLIFLTVKCIALRCMIGCTKVVQPKQSTVSHCLQFGILLERLTLQCHLKVVHQMVTDCNGFISVPESTMKEQLINGPCALICWNLSVFFVKAMIDGAQYKEALFFLTQLIHLPTLSYEARMDRCRLIYYRGLAIYRLLLPSFNFNRARILTLATEQPLALPSPPQTSPKASKAPTKKRSVYSYLLRCKAGTALNGDKVVSKRQKGPEVCSNTDYNDNVILLEDSGDAILKENDLDHADGVKFLGEHSGKSSQPKIVCYNQTIESCIDFAVSDFVDTFDLSAYSLEDVKQAIGNVWQLIGLHPSWSLYQDSHLLLFKVARAKNRAIKTMLYHLSEATDFASYRYRSILVMQRKYSFQKPIFTNLQFKMKDLEYCPLVNQLPPEWRFVQIKLLPIAGSKVPELLFARIQPKGQPVFLRVPIPDSETYFLNQFEAIMRGNDSSMTIKDRHIHWKERNDLDNQLSLLLKSFEDTYLGPFKSLFHGEIDDVSFQTACSKFKAALTASTSKLRWRCSDPNLLDVFVQSVPFLTTKELQTGVQILYNLLDCTLADRLLLGQLKKTHFSKWSREKKKCQLFEKAAPVGLILDGAFAQFPFESCPTVRGLHQPMFRVPSLRTACILYQKYKNTVLANGIDDSSCYYVINPAGDLKNTDEFFRENVGEICQREKSWSGVIGTEPTFEELKDNLEGKNLYLYFGHGAGSLYYRKVPNGGLDSLAVRPTCIVIGCSSGRVCAESKSEAVYGVPYRFLINGAPCYVGNLWDVTDRDIDVFSDKFLSYSLKRWKPESKKVPSFARAISMSRVACRLPYLIGCAPVLYGLPLRCQL